MLTVCQVAAWLVVKLLHEKRGTISRIGHSSYEYSSNMGLTLMSQSTVTLNRVHAFPTRGRSGTAYFWDNVDRRLSCVQRTTIRAPPGCPHSVKVASSQHNVPAKDRLLFSMRP